MAVKYIFDTGCHLVTQVDLQLVHDHQPPGPGITDAHIQDRFDIRLPSSFSHMKTWRHREGK